MLGVNPTNILFFPTTKHQIQPPPPVVFIMGATGTGKSRLSVDLATRLMKLNAEIVNSDKMQVYKGLDVVTNKITHQERAGVPHHLLGVVDPQRDFTCSEFRLCATQAVESILASGNLPIVAGGSNSYIESLVDGKFRSKYDCCFLWVDVALPVLYSVVSDRVDRMVEEGMVDEVGRLFREGETVHDYARGIGRAIGVPELDRYLRGPTPELLREAIWEIKENTCKLAKRQRKKIERLGWDVHRLDATKAFAGRGEGTWEELVAAPAIKILKNFLHHPHDQLQLHHQIHPSACTSPESCMRATSPHNLCFN